MIQLRQKAQLDGGHYGWLTAAHHFNVTPNGNRNHAPLGPLVVLNDDEVAPGTGFGRHPHRDMEIITYVRQGAVTHRDSLGNAGRIEAGSVQVMSAGTGIQHAERNEDTDPLRIFQIWATRSFPTVADANHLVVLASGFGDEGALPIRADAKVLGAKLTQGATTSVDLAGFRHAYVVSSEGTVVVNEQRLDTGDGLAVTGETGLYVTSLTDAEVVVVLTV
jgi:redox-sensitive bicupin YhaK (pirin superfamily)